MKSELMSLVESKSVIYYIMPLSTSCPSIYNSIKDNEYLFSFSLIMSSVYSCPSFGIVLHLTGQARLRFCQEFE